MTVQYSVSWYGTLAEVEAQGRRDVNHVHVKRKGKDRVLQRVFTVKHSRATYPVTVITYGLDFRKRQMAS